MKNIKSIIFQVIFVIAILFSTYAMLASNNNSILNFFDNSDVHYYNNNWTYIDNEGKNQVVKLPIRLASKSGQITKVSNTLPNDLNDGMVLCFRTLAQSIKVQVDGNEIYSYGTDSTMFFEKTPGVVWNLIKIPNGSQGKNITFILSSPYKVFDGYINSVTYGYKNALFIKILGDNFFGLITCIIEFLFGIGFLVLYFVDKVTNNKRSNLIYLAIYALLNSIWFFCQGRLIQFFIGNQSLIDAILFSSLILSTIAIFLFIEQVCVNKNKKVFNVMYAALTLSFLISILLQIFKIADFFETIFLFHAALFISFFVSGYALCIELVKYKNKDIQPFVMSMAILIPFSLLELISYYINVFDNISLYVKIGTLIILFYLTVVYIKKAYKFVRETNEAIYLKKLAYVDMLTQGKNRNAFNLEFDIISRNLNDESNIFIAIFDLDNLKAINDNYGHLMGDSALIACYNCINYAFYPNEKIYRIGGDEFACFLENTNEEEILRNIAIFRKRTLEYDEKYQYSFSIAVGYVKYDKDIDNSFYDTFNRADQKMYDDKNKNKKSKEKI